MHKYAHAAKNIRMKIRDSLTFRILTYGRSIFGVLIGTLILSFGVAVFSIPYRLVAGGITGLAIILEAAIPVQFLTAETFAVLLSWFFFAWGWIFLGTSFSLKTLISTAVYPLGLSLFAPLAPQEIAEIGALPNSMPSESVLILAAVAGGLLVGVGCAIVFRNGGSSGGTDVLALILCRYFPRIRCATAILILDALIVFFGMAVIRSPLLALLGILHALVCATVIRLLYSEE